MTIPDVWALSYYAATGWWPMGGGADDPPADPPAGPAPEPSDDDPTTWDKARAAETIRVQRERERALKAQLKDLESTKSRLKELEDKDLSEQERLKKELDTARADSARLREEHRALRVRTAVEREAAKLGFADPSDAHRLLDVAELETNEHGEPTNAIPLLTALLTAKPYLKAGASSAGGGVPATPRANASPETDEERVKRMSKRLAESGAYTRF